MVILDAAIVTVALPSIQRDLGFSEQSLQWVVSAYALTFAGLLLLGGRAADLLGRRRVFMFGLVVFTAASLLCGLAWSPAALIGARALQGVGAAIMTPTALSIIMTTFEEGRERNKALGIWGSLGGSRRHGRVADRRSPRRRPRLAVDLLHQHPGRHRRARALPGAAQGEPGDDGRAELRPGRRADGHGRARRARLRGRRGADEGVGERADDRPPRRLRRALWSRSCSSSVRQRAPLVPLSIFRSRTLVGANSVMLFFGAVVYGMPFILTLYTQQVLGYSRREVRAHLDRLPDRRRGRVDLRPGDRPQDRLPARRRDRAWR